MFTFLIYRYKGCISCMVFALFLKIVLASVLCWSYHRFKFLSVVRVFCHLPPFLACSFDIEDV